MKFNLKTIILSAALTILASAGLTSDDFQLENQIGESIEITDFHYSGRDAIGPWHARGKKIVAICIVNEDSECSQISIVTFMSQPPQTTHYTSEQEIEYSPTLHEIGRVENTEEQIKALQKSIAKVRRSELGITEFSSNNLKDNAPGWYRGMRFPVAAAFDIVRSPTVVGRKIAAGKFARNVIARLLNGDDPQAKLEEVSRRKGWVIEKGIKNLMNNSENSKN